MELLPNSTLTKSQKQKRTREYTENGQRYRATVNIRYDDECDNGHNTFAITVDVYRIAKNGRLIENSFGCQHELAVRLWPDLAPFIKWHLVSTDGPMHYIENTTYHAKAISKNQDKWHFYLEDKLIRIVDGAEKKAMIAKYGENAVFTPYYNSVAKEADLDAARRSAIWPDATLEQLQDKNALVERLPALMEAFKRDVESLGFVY